MKQRIDGRTATEHRQLKAQLSLLTTDGSCQLSTGNTAILASVTGPIATLHHNELPAATTILVNLTPLGDSDPSSSHLSSFLQETAASLILIHSFPKSAINIDIQVLGDDGGVLATGVNGLVLALMDAGVPMKGTLVAVCVCVDNDGTVLLDPTSMELENAQSSHIVAIDPQTNDIGSIYSTGLFTSSEMDGVVTMCTEAAQSLQAFFLKVIERKVDRAFPPAKSVV